MNLPIEREAIFPRIDGIRHKHRQDIESFLSHIKGFLDQLDRYGLTLS